MRGLAVRVGYPQHLPMNFKRHVAWTVAALGFAALVLPFLVYFTGLQVFGAYRGGGPMQFLGNFYADLGRLQPGAWLLLLGPLAMVAAWRVVVALGWPRGGA